MTRELVCDFCSSKPVTHTCPCEDFDTGVPMVGPEADQLIAQMRAAGQNVGDVVATASEGNWAACERCVKLVACGARHGLARRCATVFMLDGKMPAGMVWDELVEILEGTHSDFWKHRQGPPVPLPDEDRERWENHPARRASVGPPPGPMPGWLQDVLDKQRKGKA